MDKKKFDIIIVPDFSGKARELFKIRTLFFLASWLEYGGLTKTYPLHIACIGQPPKSVRALGGRCHASFTEHQPLHEGGFLNKLRGLDITGKTEHALLLDADVLLFSDISDLTTILPPHCISADVANDAHLSNSQWTLIYSILNLLCPEIRIVTLNRRIQVNMNNNPNYEESTATFPYYNSGILFFPWACNLQNCWIEHFFKISKILHENFNLPNKRIHLMDQPALATAITSLQLQEIPFYPLPRTYHVRWQHIYARLSSIRETKLFHAVGIFKDNNQDLKKAIEIYQQILTHQCTIALEKSRTEINYLTKISIIIRYKLALRDISILHAKLTQLYTKYVQPILDN